MYYWSFAYVPAENRFTRLIVQVRAWTVEHAKMKFYTEYGDDCVELLSIERHN